MHERLKQARERAGFKTIRQAVDRFGWSYPTYAGHENGSRGFKIDTAQRYAKAYRVPVQYLMFGTTKEQLEATLEGAFSSRPKPDFAIHRDGFGEGDVAFVRPEQNPEQINKFQKVAEVLAPDVKSVSFYVSAKNTPSYMLQIDDVLVCDVNPDVKPGDDIIFTRIDPETGAGKTHIATFLPPYLSVAGDKPTMLKYNPDTDAIMAKIVASFRPPEIK